jgi:hypothetical protein
MGPPMKTALTDRAIKAMRKAAKAYDVHDAIVPALTLNVLPSGLKRFVLLTRFPGAKHPTRRALGAYGALTLGGRTHQGPRLARTRCPWH